MLSSLFKLCSSHETVLSPAYFISDVRPFKSLNGAKGRRANAQAHWENYDARSLVFRVFSALIGNTMNESSTSKYKSDAKANNEQYQIIHYDPPPISKNRRSIWKEPRYQRTNLVLCSP